MSDRGYFGIGCFHLKNGLNYGTLFRSAQIMGASYVFLIGRRFKRQASDTMKSWRHMPVFEYESITDLKNNLPYDCRLIGVELINEAKPIYDYTHPQRACYILGAEDSGLSKEVLNSCHDIIILPGERSMNVSVAGSIVMYDRLYKQQL